MLVSFFLFFVVIVRSFQVQEAIRFFFCNLCNLLQICVIVISSWKMYNNSKLSIYILIMWCASVKKWMITLFFFFPNSGLVLLFILSCAGQIYFLFYWCSVHVLRLQKKSNCVYMAGILRILFVVYARQDVTALLLISIGWMYVYYTSSDVETITRYRHMPSMCSFMGIL